MDKRRPGDMGNMYTYFYNQFYIIVCNYAEIIDGVFPR
jgi:hypothetical protein